MEEKISKSQMVEFFRRAGCHENRKVDISEVEKYYQECGEPMFQSTKRFFEQFYGLEYGSHKTDLFHTNYPQNCCYDIELLQIDFGYNFHNDMGYENITVDKLIKNDIIYDYDKSQYISKEPLQYIGTMGFCDYHWVSETGDIFIGKSSEIYRAYICKVYDNLFDMIYQDTIELKNIFEKTYDKNFEIF